MIRALLATFFGIGIAGASANAAVFCVTNGTELHNALLTAGSNGADDEIRVGAGVFTFSSGSTAFSYSTNEDFNVSIVGGYNTGCSSIVVFPILTTLNGDGARQVLSVKGSSASHGSLYVAHLLIRNGYSDQLGAGLSMGGPAGFAGRASVQNVVFVNNTSTTAAGGLAISADLGRITVNNSLFIANACAWDSCAFDLISNAASTPLDPTPVEFGNNTVVDNYCIAGAPASCDVTGGRFFGSAHAAFFNNVFAFNDEVDLRVQGANVDLDHNNIPLWVGTPSQADGNLALSDPQFVGSGNYRLRSDSPLRDGGVMGFYPFYTVDLDGQTRVYGPSVDIGAFENHVAIFGNGFDTPY